LLVVPGIDALQEGHVKVVDLWVSGGLGGGALDVLSNKIDGARDAAD